MNEMSHNLLQDILYMCIMHIECLILCLQQIQEGAVDVLSELENITVMSVLGLLLGFLVQQRTDFNLLITNTSFNNIHLQSINDSPPYNQQN